MTACTADPPAPPARRIAAWVGAVLGLLSAGLALGVGELVAVFVRPAASPVVVVGNRFVLLTPAWLKEFAIRHFGTNDKDVLLGGIYVTVAVLALVLGALAARRWWIGPAGLAVFGAVGVYCALSTAAHRGGDVLPVAVGTLVAMAVLTALLGAAGAPVPAAPVGPSRRALLAGAVGTAGVAVLGGLGGRAWQRARSAAEASRAAVALPRAASPAPALAPGTDLGQGAAPFVTPLDAFYRVDTALSVPQLTTAGWSLRIHGMVDRPMTISWDQLVARPMIERWLTLMCVSNDVGGDLVGTARFQGVPLAGLLREAGVQPGADQLIASSSDGMTIGTPTAVAMDGRDTMLAIAMDGRPLPVQHGFPVRMITPGLYGYVGACKWIVDIRATTFAATRAFWTQQGYLAQAPVQIASRIDTPVASQSWPVGTDVPIAGVAWQTHVGIERVEVRVDRGPWQAARLGRVPSIDTWVQWVLPWTVPSAGPHTLTVRAVDRDGVVQSAAVHEPYPGAASGYHTITVHGS